MNDLLALLEEESQDQLAISCCIRNRGKDQKSMNDLLALLAMRIRVKIYMRVRAGERGEPVLPASF